MICYYSSPLHCKVWTMYTRVQLKGLLNVHVTLWLNCLLSQWDASVDLSLVQISVLIPLPSPHELISMNYLIIKIHWVFNPGGLFICKRECITISKRSFVWGNYSISLQQINSAVKHTFITVTRFVNATTSVHPNTKPSKKLLCKSLQPNISMPILHAVLDTISTLSEITQFFYCTGLKRRGKMGPSYQIHSGSRSEQIQSLYGGQFMLSTQMIILN